MVALAALPEEVEDRDAFQKMAFLDRVSDCRLPGRCRFQLNLESDSESDSMSKQKAAKALASVDS